MKVKPLREISSSPVDCVIAKHRGKPGELLSILEELQEANSNKFLPKEILKEVSLKLNVPLSKIYSVVTFYAFFNLKPQGKHTITVCRGTACHTRGSKELLKSVSGMLGFDEEELEESGKLFLTTKDNQFTIKTVACFGQCALAPVVEIDGNVHGYVSSEKLKALVKSVSSGKSGKTSPKAKASGKPSSKAVSPKKTKPAKAAAKTGNKAKKTR